jgi:TonB dependent receptor
MFASWLFDKAPFTVPDAFGTIVNTDNTFRQLFIVEETHSFSPNVLNTVRLGYNFEKSKGNFPLSTTNPLASDPSLAVIPGGAAPAVSIGGGYTVYLGGLATGASEAVAWNSYQLYDDAFFTRGKHTFKFGGSVENMRMGLQSGISRGRYAFSNLSSFLTNQPSSFKGVDPLHTKAVADYRQTLFGLYAQDDWKLRPNLSLNLGVRYEPATTFAEGRGRLAFLYDVTQAVAHLGNPGYSNSTLTNFSPRLGFAYDPFNNGKTSVRGAVGLFEALPLIYQWSVEEVNVAPQGLVATATNRTLLHGTFPGSAYQQLSVTALAAVVTDKNPKPSRVLQWNLSLQRQLTKKLSATATYVGSSSEHLPVATADTNIVIPNLIQGRYVTPLGGAKVNPHFGKIASQFYNGHAHYHALQAQITQQVTRGLSFQGSFTYGKSLDNGSINTPTPTPVHRFLI